MGVDEDGIFWILDIERGQWSAHRREKIIKATAEADGVNVSIYHEQEPGSGGKESADRIFLPPWMSVTLCPSIPPGRG